MISMEQGNLGRQALNTSIQDLEREILEMGSLADAMAAKAVDALAHMEVELAKHVMSMDDEVDLMDTQIEEHCMRLLALQQPMASNLRLIGAVMKIATDIERVGDLSVDLAKICLKIEAELGEANIIDIRKMGQAARGMFLTSLDAFVKRSPELVMKVVDGDDEVDQLYRDLRLQVFENMRNYPQKVVSDGWLLLAVHHVERIADHAVNIAERVHFLITGKVENLSRIRKDSNTI